MKVNLKDLSESGERFQGEDPPEIMDLANEPGITITSPLRYDLHVQQCGETLIVHGSLAIDVTFRCVRCTEPFSSGVREPEFDCAMNIESDVETGDRPSRSRPPHSEPPQFADLTPDMRESILLAFPAHPVCNAGCKGLCPQCGVNWNQAPCDCREPTDLRWNELDGLRIESKE